MTVVNVISGLLFAAMMGLLTYVVVRPIRLAVGRLERGKR